MIETKSNLLSLPHSQQIEGVKNMGLQSFSFIAHGQKPNGLIPASPYRFDDPYFKDGVWIKDHVRAVKPLSDPFVRKNLPEIYSGSGRTGLQVYLLAMREVLVIQTQNYDDHNQWERFYNRPGCPDEKGYSTIDCNQTPAIKFTSTGEMYIDWGHNQPDNLGTLTTEIGKGIKQELPILKPIPGCNKFPGEIIDHLTSYQV